MNTKIAFIGAGNMARSILQGMIGAGFTPENITLSNPSLEKLTDLQTNYGVKITQDNLVACEQADIILLCTKPAMLPTVLTEMAKTVHPQQVLFSIAAGTTIETISQYFTEPMPIIRCMPNTPAMIQAGASALYANQNCNKQQQQLAESIAHSVGEIAWLSQEDHMDIITALSGSGPAYFYYIFEALSDAAQALGLDSEIARKFILQTGLGTAKLALQRETPLETLRQEVTSKGGTTEAAMQYLDNHDTQAIFAAALKSAYQRAKEIAKE